MSTKDKFSMKEKKLKLVYVLPSYDAKAADHFAHIPNLLQKLGEHVEITLIVERCEHKPQLRNIKRVYTIPLGNIVPLKFLRIAFLTIKLRMLGYKHFFIRISQNAALPICITTKVFGGIVYFWHSTMSYESLPRWQLKLKVIQHKLFSEIPFRLVLWLVDYLATGPERMRDYYADNWKVPREKIMVLYNDINLDVWKPVPPEQKYLLRKELGLPLNSHIILHVHRFSPIRRLSFYFPKLFHLIFDKCAYKPFFVMCGGGPDEEHLKQAVEAENLSNHVIMKGFVPNRELPKFYAAADVFILPTWADAFPRVLLEAMAAGLPFVTTDVGGIPDVVIENQKRFLVHRENINEFAQKVLELLDNEELRKKLSRENLERIKCFSTEVISKMYIDRIFHSK